MSKNTNNIESLLKLYMKRTEKEKQDYIVELYKKNKALKDKVKNLDGEKSEIYDLLVGSNGEKRYTHEELVSFIIKNVGTRKIKEEKK